jgi:hypothetical protein
MSATGTDALLLSVEEVVQDIEGFLRGSIRRFRYGNSAHFFDAFTRYALARLAL